MKVPAGESGWRLLLASNGSAAGKPALDYGVWLAGRLAAEVRLLGIDQSGKSGQRLRNDLEETERELLRLGLRHTVHMQQGESIQTMVQAADWDGALTVFGPFGYPFWERWLRGRSFRRMMEAIESPMIYYRAGQNRLDRMLICLGGLGYALAAEVLGLRLARAFGSSVTLLHVVEPVGYDYPTARAVQTHWQDILETDTPQGANSRRAVEMAEQAGITPDFQVRQGSVVHEVLSEARTSSYDLIVMGSPYSVQSLRSQFLTNVTASVAEAAPCPVLTLRGEGAAPAV